MPTHEPPKILEQLLSQPTDQAAGSQVQQICSALQKAGVQPGESSAELDRVNRKEEAQLLDSINEYFERVVLAQDPLVSEEQTQTRCRWLIAGGMKPKAFEQTVMASDCSARCGCVWEPNTLAFRCRTCAKSMCMSLCVDCFKMADHTNHDYNRFWSQAGGACDCGDDMVMHPSGFCSRHGRQAIERKRAHASEHREKAAQLVAVASYLFPKLFARLLHRLRDRFQDVVKLPPSHQLREDSVEQIFETIKPLLVFLNDYAVMGGYMRALFSQLFLDRELYSRICQSLSPPVEAAALLGAEAVEAQSSAQALQVAVQSLESVCNSRDAQVFECKHLFFCEPHQSLLDELTFWLTRLEYPQKLVTFMLTILPEDEFKVEFASRFFAHYACTAELLRIQSHKNESSAGENLSNRIVHISVQILSGQELCEQLAARMPLIRLIIGCVKGILRQNLVASELAPPRAKPHSDDAMDVDDTAGWHQVLSCESNTIKHHQYWPLVTDLHSVVTHRSLAHAFLRDPVATQQWLLVLGSMQGMNCNKRIVAGEHVGTDSRSYYWSYTAELEIASSVKWCLVNACDTPETTELLYSMIEALVAQIKRWFEAIGFDEQALCRMSRTQLSFHLPLHRYYAAFLSHACNVLDVVCELPADNSTFIMQLAMHPLQIQVGRAEVACNMWVRNGHDLRYQAWLYVQSAFCTSFADLDLYLLQMCASSLAPIDWLVMIILDRFHLRRFFTSTGPVVTYPDAIMRPEWTQPMLEAALRLIALLAALRCNNGMQGRSWLVAEVSATLAMGDSTHSQLKEKLPAKGAHDATIETHLDCVLEEVAAYKAPDVHGGQTQGMHVPKDVLWSDHYDPLFVQLRATQQQNYAQSLLRFTEYVRRSGLNASDIWPPYRVPRAAANNHCVRLLHCRSLHATVFIVLYKFWADRSVVSEDSLALAVHLLQLAVHCEDESPQHSPQPQQLQSCAALLHLLCLYKGDSVFANLSHRVNVTPDQQQLDVNPHIVGINEALTSNESILSLLIRIHKQKSGEQQLWSAEEVLPAESRYEARHVIDSLIKHVYNTDVDCRRELDRVCATFGRQGVPCRLSTTSVDLNNEAQAKCLEERRAQARKRQQLLMQQMSQKAARVLKKMMADEQTGEPKSEAAKSDAATTKMDVDENKPVSAQQQPQPDELECVICSCTARSTPDKPLGLVSQCVPNARSHPINPSQPNHTTSRVAVLGHALPTDVPVRDAVADADAIAAADDELHELTPDQCYLRAHYSALLAARLHGMYKSAQPEPAFGIRVSTCRHYVHLACHESYMNSLDDMHDVLLISPQHGEYLCPMCRRVSNCVLPIQPPVRPAHIESAITAQPPIDPECLHMVSAICLQSTQQLRRTTALVRANTSFIDACHAACRALLPYRTSTPNQLLVPALLSHNIDYDLMLHDAGLRPQHSANAELVPVLSAMLLFQTSEHLADLQSQWAELCARATHDDGARFLPTIYTDSSVLLVRLCLLVLSNRGCDQDQLCVSLCTVYRLLLHHCCVRACLQLVQQTSLVGCPHPLGCVHLIGLQSAVRALVADLSIASAQSTYVTQLCKYVLNKIAHLNTGVPLSTVAELDAALRVRVSHFVRVAQCLFEAARIKLPLVFSDKIELNEPSHAGSAGPAGHVLQLIGAWLHSLAPDAQQPLAPFNVPLCWQRPRLLHLPHNYDTLFEMYISRKCSRCDKVPKEVLLCLVCGRLLCHSTLPAHKCCQRPSADTDLLRDEAELHVAHCGAGHALLLSVHTSLVFVVRGRRAGVWGSLYLDKHGEEDRGLKRGKPLFLCDARYEALQQQWLELQPGGRHLRLVPMPAFLQYMDVHD